MSFPTAFRALAPAAAIIVAAAPAAAQSNSDIAKVEAHLKAAQSMTANFVQTDAKGRSIAGTLQLKRPGRIRFEYGKGADMLLVTDPHGDVATVRTDLGRTISPILAAAPPESIQQGLIGIPASVMDESDGLAQQRNSDSGERRVKSLQIRVPVRRHRLTTGGELRFPQREARVIHLAFECGVSLAKRLMVAAPGRQEAVEPQAGSPEHGQRRRDRADAEELEPLPRQGRPEVMVAQMQAVVAEAEQARGDLEGQSDAPDPDADEEEGDHEGVANLRAAWASAHGLGG